MKLGRYTINIDFCNPKELWYADIKPEHEAVTTKLNHLVSIGILELESEGYKKNYLSIVIWVMSIKIRNNKINQV